MLELVSRKLFERDVDRIDPRALAQRGCTILQADFPVLDVLFGHPATPLRVRMTAKTWNERPPVVDLLDAVGDPLGCSPPWCGGIFHGGPHPDTGRPFVCMRGTEEYHTHPSHVQELWDNYRGKPGLDLAGILHQIWTGWKRAVG